jgi:hypothetical protein
MAQVCRLFYFLVIFSKDSLKYAHGGKILENRLGLGAIHASAKVTQLDAVGVGAKPHAT